MRTFPLRPAPPSAPAFDLTLTMGDQPSAPPAAPPPPPCSAAQLWQPLQNIATSIQIDPTLDPSAYGMRYDGAGLFTCVHSTNGYGAWNISTLGIDAPIMCALQVVSGSLQGNVSFLVGNGTYIFIDTLTLPPYFLLNPNADPQQIQFYEKSDGDHFATPVTFRVIAFQLELP